jgi:AcrR family transcriptional regulator
MPGTTTTSNPASSIADVKRQATTDLVLVAARQLLMSDGLDVTMDQIAEAAGVGRRTLFRYFCTRERLLADALESGVQLYGELLPTFHDDWRTWLREICQAAHHMQASYGPGYWELISRTDLPAELAAVNERRHTRRTTAMSRIASKLWREAGGTASPPPHVMTGVSAHLSPRFTAAVTQDAGASWQTAAELSYGAIAELLTRSTAGVTS